MTDAPESTEPADDEQVDEGGQPTAVPDELGSQPTGDEAAKPSKGDDDTEADGRAR